MQGSETIRVRSHSIGGNQGDLWLNNVNENISHTARSLLGPDEILNTDFSRQLIFRNNLKPVLTNSIRYYEKRYWKGLWGAWEPHAA